MQGFRHCLSQRILTYRTSITVQLTSCLTRLDLTKQVNLLLFNISKATESKQVKREVSCTVTIPL